MSYYAFWFYGSSHDVWKILMMCSLSRITKAAVTTSSALCFDMHLKLQTSGQLIVYFMIEVWLLSKFRYIFRKSCAEAANQIGQAHAYI